MIGHQQIIKARRQGLRPASVFFEFGYPPAPSRFEWAHPERALENNLFPVVQIPREQAAMRHDLRFVTGCLVHAVAPEWSPDFIAFGDALADAGASTVAMCAIAECGDIRIFHKGEWRAVID